MKTYRLKKDSLIFKAGELFELRPGRGSDESVLFKCGTDIALALDGEATTLQELISKDSEWFEEIEGAWRPKPGEEYWQINDSGFVSDLGLEWSNHGYDQRNLAIGNCFPTKEAAEKAVEWLKARKILFDDAKGFKPDWSSPWQKKYAVFCDTMTMGKMLFVCHEAIAASHCGPYFATRDDAKASIEAHEKEWKIYLGVEE